MFLTYFLNDKKKPLKSVLYWGGGFCNQFSSIFFENVKFSADVAQHQKSLYICDSFI